MLKNKIINIKRKTGITNNQTIYNWCLCYSLSLTNKPKFIDFADLDDYILTGEYEVLIYYWIKDNNLNIDDIDKWTYSHTKRGADLLSVAIKNKKDLLNMLTNKTK